VVAATVAGERVKILLPADYRSSKRRYPALYLLHGSQGSEDSWLVYSDLVEFTRPLTGARGAIVVMPGGDGSGLWIDWRNGRHHYERDIVDGLIHYVDRHFRTLPDRAHRAIAGYSAGGFSVMHIAARHPDLFAAAGAFSGALNATYRSPIGEAVFNALFGVGSACEGGSPTDSGAVGDPVTQEIWWHNANPVDLAPNFTGMAEVYAASGNGVPCDLNDAVTLVIPFADLEPGVEQMTEDFDAALTDARVAHTTDLYGCGIHWWPYWQRDLHDFWPRMLRAFGSPPPARFRYRTAEPDFSVWGWRFRADPARAAEFLDVSDGTSSALTLTGSGAEMLTTPARYRPGQTVRVTGAKPTTATADSRGRVTVTVGLGPPDKQQEYAPGASAPRRTSRRVTFRAVRSGRQPGSRQRSPRSS
jgi:S-formylglutathione hydrolase FrmB